ncbi:hypothetical protein LOD99_13371 [Oopsacas minuta]|uniref:Uncharacterized protein n=1 Tax=Oopsacas minuta TaxID=111878 RepID=A0AAV7KKC7_9METZ|nr:hypothetical protein LOD99_13371 [Oopsacas minuta]
MKNKHKIIYPDLESARRPVSHNVSLPIPTPTLYEFDSLSDDVDTLSYSMDDSSIGSEYVTEDSNLAPQTFTQGELNDLVRDLDLSKEKAELLASRLQQKNLLNKNVIVSHYRKRNF